MRISNSETQAISTEQLSLYLYFILCCLDKGNSLSFPPRIQAPEERRQPLGRAQS
jgi:hypothetical protein